MLILLAAIASQTSTPTVPTKPGDSITVIGKSKLVCVQSIVTGSRARGGKVCRSQEVAAAEGVAGREAARDAAQLDRTREALRCDGIKMCN